MKDMFERFDRVLRIIAVSLILIMLALLTVQVAMRYVGNIALSWSEELSLLGFTWVVVIGTAVGVRTGLHARMSILVDNLPGGLKHWLERLIALLVLVLGLVMAVSGWSYVKETQGMYSAAMRYPMAWLYTAAPVFGVLLVVFAFERLIYGPAIEAEI